MVFPKRATLQQHAACAVDDTYRNRPMPPAVLMGEKFRRDAGLAIVLVDQNDEVVVGVHRRIPSTANRQQASPRALQWVSTTFALGDTRA